MDRSESMTRQSPSADILSAISILFMLVFICHDIFSSEGWTAKLISFLGLAIPLVPYILQAFDSHIHNIGVLKGTLVYIKYSSSAFVIAILVDRTLLLNVAQEGMDTSVYIVLSIVGLVVMISFFYYLLDRFDKYYVRQKENISRLKERMKRAERRSGIMDFEGLLEKVECKNGDVLAVGGNLLSLATSKGIRLLNKFLSNPDKEVYLFITDEARERLSYIKDNIDENSYLDRVVPVVYKPFMFLQGVVIVGHSGPEGDRAIGCYFYKPRFYKEQEMAEEGIFIDLNEVTSSEREGSRRETIFCRSVSAYLHLLRELKYKWTDNISTYTINKNLEVTNGGQTIGWKDGEENIVDWEEVDVN